MAASNRTFECVTEYLYVELPFGLIRATLKSC